MSWHANATARRTVAFGLACTMIFSVALFADNPPAKNDAEEISADRIAKLIEQLGASDFSAREKAQSELAQAGLEAYDALHAAQSHRDYEIALRARYLVRSMTGSVRWFSDSDSPKVVAILKEYGDLAEADKKSRIDRLAVLEDGLGIAPLIRLARFETSDPLAKYAALQVLERSPPIGDAPIVDLAKKITNIVGASKRPAASWLRLYARTLTDPVATLAEWDQATQAERAVLEKSPDRTSQEIVRDFYRFRVELLHRLNRDKEAEEVIRQTFVSPLIDGTADQIQEAADWLAHRESWVPALELMQRFDAVVQENPRLLYRLAAIYDRLEQPANAEELAKKALGIKPEAFAEHLQLGRELDLAPRLAKWAEAEYRQALANAMPGSPADFSVRFKLSELLHDRLRELEAAETLKPVTDLMAKDENAKDTWNRATPLSAEQGIARMNFFFASYHHEQGNYQKEKEHLKLAIDAHYKDGDVLIAMYRLPNADAAWKAMTKEKIELVTTESLREVEEARTGLELSDDERGRVVAMAELAEGCNNFAWLVGNTFGDHEKAVQFSAESVKICRQLPELKPNLAGFLDTLGRAHYGAGDVANAMKCQSEAVALNPISGQLRRQLGFFTKEAADRGIAVPSAESPAYAPTRVPAAASAPSARPAAKPVVPPPAASPK